MTLALTLDDRAVLSLDELEQCYQALLFYADRLAIRATAQITPGPTGDYISRKLSELADLGLLLRWAHEYEVDSGGRLRGVQGAGSVPLVIPAEEVREVVGEVDEALRQDRTPAYEPRGTEKRQGVLEIARLRRQLTIVSVTSRIGLDGVLSRRDWARNLHAAADSPPGPGKFQESVVREVVSLCEFGSLSGLPPEAIESARKHRAPFQEFLERSAGGELLVRGAADPRAVAEGVVRQYRAILEEYGRPHVVAQARDEAGWDVLGAVLPPTIVLKFGLKSIRWRRKQQEFEPFLLLSDIRRGLSGTGSELQVR